MNKLLTLVLINLLSFSVSALTFTNSNTSSGSSSSSTSNSPSEGKKTLYDSEGKPIMDGYWNGVSPWKYAFEIVKKPYPIRYGTTSERFELRYGDCGATKTYSDCTSPYKVARSEIGMHSHIVQARYNQDIWYGWSFYNETIPTIGLGNVIGQWKNGVKGNNNPLIFIRQTGDVLNSWRSQIWKNCHATFCSNHLETKDSYDVLFNLGAGGKFKSRGKSNVWNSPCRLWSMEENKGKWVDLVLNTNFGTDENGYANVWINGEKRCEYRGKFLDYSDTLNSNFPGPSHRRGIYTSRTKLKTKTHPTLIAYFDEFRVGRSRKEVDIRMIEDPNYQPPKIKCAKGFINKNESCKKDISTEYDGKYSFGLFRPLGQKQLAYGQMVIKDGQVKVDTTKSWVSDEIADPLDSLRGTVDRKGNVDWYIEIDPWKNPPKYPEDVNLEGNINDSGSISGVVVSDGETKLELTVNKVSTEYDGKYSFELNRLHKQYKNELSYGQLTIKDGQVKVDTTKSWVSDEIADPLDSLRGTVDRKGNVDWYIEIDPWKNPPKYPEDVNLEGNINDSGSISGVVVSDGETKLELTVNKVSTKKVTKVSNNKISIVSTEYDGKYSVQLNRLHLETGNLKPRGSAEFEIMDGNLIVSTENRRIHRKIDDPFDSFEGKVDSDGNVTWSMRIDPWSKSKWLHDVSFTGNLNDDELITGMYDDGTEVQLEVFEIE